MTKAELAEKLALKTNINKKQAEIVINSMIKSINDALANGDKVELRGFGVLWFGIERQELHAIPSLKKWWMYLQRKYLFLKQEMT